MKKNLLIYALLITMPLSSLVSCHRVAGNHLYFYKESFKEKENVIEINASSGELINIDKEKKTYSSSDTNTESIFQCVVIGGTAPRYSIFTQDGYGAIKPKVLLLNELKNGSVLYTQGYELDNYVYGICNVYYDTIGYLSGGGNYGEEEIAYSIYYKYDNDKDTLETLCRINEGTMVAFNDSYVVYWKNCKFYSYNLITQEEKLLCSHLSYDYGIQHQSSTMILFNQDYVLIKMKKAKLVNDYYYYYLYEFGKDIIELEIIS